MGSFRASTKASAEEHPGPHRTGAFPKIALTPSTSCTVNSPAAQLGQVITKVGDGAYLYQPWKWVRFCPQPPRPTPGDQQIYRKASVRKPKALCQSNRHHPRAAPPSPRHPGQMGSFFPIAARPKMGSFFPRTPLLPLPRAEPPPSGLRYIHIFMRLTPSRLAFMLSATAALSLPLLAAEEAELKDSSGKTIIRYVVEAPKGIAPAGTTDPAKQLGLFLCFAEHERPTGDEILPVREALRRQGLSDQFVLVAGHSQALKMSMADHEPIRQLAEWAMKTYPINPRRIYMYGKGEGGKVSGEFGSTHPKLITASITYSWGWWVMPSELTEPIDPIKSAPEFYMVLGLRDLATHINTVRDTYTRLNAKGYHLIYREFDELGARTYHPPSNDDAIAWATRLRNKNIPPSAAESKLLNQFDADPPPAAGPGGYYDALALVGGAPAGTIVRKLLRNSNHAVRAAAAETCTHAIFSEETAAALAQSAVDPSPKVRRAAFRALAMYANWRSAAAQQVLIDLASHPEKLAEPSDRMSVVDAIGFAVRFQVKGVRQDPPMFQALVGLLTDKDEAVRVMAANILAPIRDPEFRGDGGRPEKKTPPGGWEQWLDEISAKEAGYRKDYDVCKPEAADAPGRSDYCTGGSYLLGFNPATGQPVAKQPAQAFQKMMHAAEQGYVPAEAALGMMYANGQGVQQNYVEAGKWWSKAAAGGHVLAAANAARAPKVPVPGAIPQ